MPIYHQPASLSAHLGASKISGIPWRFALGVLLVGLLYLALPTAAKAEPPFDPLVATCIEGDFFHIQTGRCLPLHTTYGFDAFPEPSTTVALTGCTVAELRSAVAQGDRRILLRPGCTYELGGGDLSIQSNTIIEGAGVDDTLITCAGTTAFRIHDVTNVIVRNLTIDGLNNQQASRGCNTLVFIDNNADNVLVERVRLRNGLGKGVGFRRATRVTVRYSWVADMWDTHGLNADNHFVNIAYYSNYITNVGTSSGETGYGINSHATQVELAGNYIEQSDGGIKLMGARYTLLHHNTIISSTSSNPLYRGVWTAVDDNDGVKPIFLVYYANFIDTGGERPFSILDGATEIYLAGNSFGAISPVIPISAGSNVYVCSNASDSQLVGDLIPISSKLINFPDSGMGDFDPCALGGEVDGPPIITVQPQDQRVAVGGRASFRAEVAGPPPLQIQWQRKWGADRWINIFQSTNAAHASGKLSLIHSGNQYRVKVTNAFGETISRVVTIEVAETGSETNQEEACLQGERNWQNQPFAPQASNFQATFTATPPRDQLDGVVGLSLGPGADFADLAVIVRFNDAGEIDVRDGPLYRADQVVGYRSGATYIVRLAVDMTQQKYDVYVANMAGGRDEEIRLAQGYSFRSDLGVVDQLDSLTLWDGIGGLRVCDLRVGD